MTDSKPIITAKLQARDLIEAVIECVEDKHFATVLLQ